MAVAAGSAVFTPPSVNQLFSPRGQILFQVAGTDREIVLSEGEDFTVTPELTESEYRSKSYPKSVMVKKSVFATALNMAMTLKGLNKNTLAALFMGRADRKLVQAAVAGGSVEFDAPRVGDIFDLGALDIVVSAVTDGAGEPFEEGTHYSVDSASGRVEVLAVPAGATSIEISFTAPEIGEADDRQLIGILESEGLRGKIVFRELGAEGPFNWIAEYWDVELRPTGAIPHLGGDEFASIELAGTAYAKGGKPAGQEYGRVVVIPKH